VLLATTLDAPHVKSIKLLELILFYKICNRIAYTLTATRFTLESVCTLLSWIFGTGKRP